MDLVTITSTLQGALRGRKPNRKAYGRHKIISAIDVGFKYREVLKASCDIIYSRSFYTLLMDKLDEEGIFVKRVDCDFLIEDQYDKIKSKLTDNWEDKESIYTPAPYFGVGFKRHNKTGGIYVSGLQICQKVVNHDHNGDIPAPNSKAKAIVKRSINGLIPLGIYRTYKLIDVVNGVRIPAAEWKTGQDALEMLLVNGLSEANKQYKTFLELKGE